MNCPQCKNEMVKVRATNFGEDYNYCRVCKKEEKELISDKLENYPDQGDLFNIQCTTYGQLVASTGQVVSMKNTLGMDVLIVENKEYDSIAIASLFIAINRPPKGYHWNVYLNKDVYILTKD
jgi:formylmethanofuran dehydrogenase subunit D